MTMERKVFLWYYMCIRVYVLYLMINIWGQTSVVPSKHPNSTTKVPLKTRDPTSSTTFLLNGTQLRPGPLFSYFILMTWFLLYNWMWNWSNYKYSWYFENAFHLSVKYVLCHYLNLLFVYVSKWLVLKPHWTALR